MNRRIEACLGNLQKAESEQRAWGKTLKKAGVVAVGLGIGLGAVDMLTYKSPARAVLRASGFIASAAGLSVIGEGLEQRADNAGIVEERLADRRKNLAKLG